MTFLFFFQSFFNIFYLFFALKLKKETDSSMNIKVDQIPIKHVVIDLCCILLFLYVLCSSLPKSDLKKFIARVLVM